MSNAKVKGYTDKIPWDTSKNAACCHCGGTEYEKRRRKFNYTKEYMQKYANRPWVKYCATCKRHWDSAPTPAQIQARIELLRKAAPEQFKTKRYRNKCRLLLPREFASMLESSEP